MDTPPAYHEAVKGRPAIQIVEKAEAQSNKSSKMSTLKSILSGKVQRHNQYASLERSLDSTLYESKSSRK
ncbi:hypothetical protein AMS68_000307 [Peltaster fructicola]|uniref:Uncharacterized protein n=1 Tax=Peltaster fructicola TaxID=286661 RepID=A0A6H0XJU4_9PEZI|nr:hypothetical protein AMS68_000307 [Peltaster fructicola]